MIDVSNEIVAQIKEAKANYIGKHYHAPDVLIVNPYVAAATAIAAVVAAVVAFTNKSEDAETQTENLNEKLDRQIALYKGVGTAALGADVKLAQLQASAEARNITLEKAIELERTRAKEVRDEANAELIRLESLRGEQRLNQETLRNRLKQKD